MLSSSTNISYSPIPKTNLSAVVYFYEANCLLPHKSGRLPHAVQVHATCKGLWLGRRTIDVQTALASFQVSTCMYVCLDTGLTVFVTCVSTTVFREIGRNMTKCIRSLQGSRSRRSMRSTRVTMLFCNAHGK